MRQTLPSVRRAWAPLSPGRLGTRLRSPVSWLMCALTVVAALAGPEAGTDRPQRVVVLTFDDAVRSHLTVVAPILKEHGFGATFFVTAAWMPDRKNYLSWDEVRRLDRMGFEIGNHTWNHVALHGPDGGRLVESETERVEAALKSVGVRKPVSFSWPGNHFGPEAREALMKRGYRYGRRGPSPGLEPAPPVGMGPVFDVRQHDPLLIPSSGLASPAWTAADFRRIVERASEGRIVVLQFHGVPDEANPSGSVTPEQFEEFVRVLRVGKYRVIPMRDLARHGVGSQSVGDANVGLRFER